MKVLRRLPIAVPAALLLLCVFAAWWTRGAMTHMPFRGKGRGAPDTTVDQRSWQTIASLAPLAVSAEEQSYAREAERLADHGIDQAFAFALRQAALRSRNLTGEALAAQEKVNQLQAIIKEDQAKVNDLTAKLKLPNGAIAPSDDLDLAKAQLQLDNDELGDANEHLAHVSGDKRPQIQQELTAREAAMKKFDSQASGGQIAILSSTRHGTLAGRISSWFDQRSRMDLLRQAKIDTDADVARLTTQHDDFEKRADAAASAVASPASDAQAAQTRVASMAQAHSLAQMHNIVEDQLETQTQLSTVYGKWLAQVQLQHGMVSHLVLESFAWIAFILLCAALLTTGLRALLDRATMDRRRLHTLRTIVTLSIQVITLGLVLLIVFGAPSQVPTILGLGAAGLTVVFQDFILAFFGWFILMGKNGIRVGDWVEINGVGGEVIEIGLFRTALLETGNWTDKGHPTGRRVTFINNFAITGQYFNFTTSGQWMWDEITVSLPPGVDPAETVESIHTTVLKETEKDADLAEQEWQKTTPHNGLSQFKAAPSVDLRPAGAGMDLVVRYVTRAADRFDMRNRVYQSVIDQLHKQPDEAADKVLATNH